MRTGTKFAGLLVMWAVAVISLLFWWLIINDQNPVTEKIWPLMPAIITAILGPAGLNMGVNEVRKAIESGGLSELAQRFRKKKGEEGREE